MAMRRLWGTYSGENRRQQKARWGGKTAKHTYYRNKQYARSNVRIAKRAKERGW